jgi:hypothetical protein
MYVYKVLYEYIYCRYHFLQTLDYKQLSKHSMYDSEVTLKWFLLYIVLQSLLQLPVAGIIDQENRNAILPR